MKILFVFDELSYGGAQKMLSYVINCASEIFDDIYILLQNTNNVSYEIPRKSKLLEFKNKINIYDRKCKKIYGFFCQIQEIRNIVISDSINVVCTFGIFYSLLILLSTIGTKAKTIVSERRSPANLKRAWRIVSKYVYSKCDMVVFQLKEVSDYYSEICENQKRIIPNPYFDASNNKQTKIKKEKQIIMAAARLEYEKGFDIGIKAMELVHNKHPDYKMHIYGSGDFNKKYQKLINSLGLDKVVIYKGISSDIINEIKKSKIFVLPSRFEGIPNILMEAMGTGTACIAADCPPGGPKLLFENDKYGLLFPVEDYQSLSNHVCNLIENSNILHKYEKASLSVRRRFSSRGIAKMWKNCFLTILKK